MSDNNFVDPDQIYPFVHPDELEVVLGGIVGDDPYKVYTFDTLETLAEYEDNYKFPFSDDEGNNPEPGWSFLVRINETYEGQAGRLILWYAVDYDPPIENDGKNRNLSKYLEIPIQNGYADNDGDGTNDSYVDGGLFGDYQITPNTVPSATLSLDGQTREATPPPTSEENPSTKETSVEAAAEKSAGPAKTETDATQSDVEEKIDPANALPSGAEKTTRDTALADPAIDTAIRTAPESDSTAAAALADEYAGLQTELSGTPTLARTNEIVTRMDAIANELPPSASAAKTAIQNAIETTKNPGNIPGLESVIGQATQIAGDFIPGASSAIGDITNELDFASGLNLSSLSNLAQSVTSSLKSTSGLLGGGSLLNNLPDINSLFQFDPKALFKSIDLGEVVNSLAKVDTAAIAKDLQGGIMDVVDQTAATFGPVGRSIVGRSNIGTDVGAGYVGSRSTTSGAAITQIKTERPVDTEKEIASGNVYTDLIELLNKSLRQDWTVKSGSNAGQKPSSQDPRPYDRIAAPPPGANPLIMEAYRISGQNGFTRDGVTGEYSWHTAFVNYILSKAGLPIVASMSAQSYYSYGQRVNHTNVRNLRAEKGDIVIFNSRTGGKYIGFFWEYDSKTRKITILGGNIDGKVKLEQFPYTLKNGDLYVTHIRRNWKIPAKKTNTSTSTTTTTTAGVFKTGPQ